MRARQLATCILTLVLIALAATPGLCSTGSYLGQEPPGLTPVRFAPELLTAYSFGCTFNADLTEFWFTEQTVYGHNSHIVGYELDGGSWNRLARPAFVATSAAIEPCIAPAGNKLFFTGSTSGAVWQAYVSERTADGWSRAVTLPGPINTSGYQPMYLSATRDGTLYWTAFIDSGAVIVRTRWTGTGYGPVEQMSSGGVAWAGAHPFVAADESFVIFDVRHGNSWEELADLVVVFRRADGTWTEPRAIAAVNGGATDEMCASLSPDGRYLFFARDMRIWWVDAAVLDPLRP